MTETLKIQFAIAGLQSVVRGINSISGALSGIGAAVAGSALVGQFSRVSEAMAKTAADAEKFGVSAEFLSSFQYALRLTGVEQSKLGEAMKGYVERARSQGRAVGDMSEELLKQADVFARMPDGPAKAALAIDTFGEAGIALIPVLNKGGDGLKVMADEAKRFGIVMDDDAAKSAKALKIDMERLDASIEGVKVQIVKGVTPALLEMSKVTQAALMTGADSSGKGAIWQLMQEDAAALFERVVRSQIKGAVAMKETFGALWSGASATESIQRGFYGSEAAADAFNKHLQQLRKPLKDVAKETEALVAGMNVLARDRALAMANLSIADATNAGSMVPDRKKRDRSREIAQQRLDEIKSQIQSLEAEAEKSMYEYTADPMQGGQATERNLQAREKRIALLKEEAQAQAELNRLGASESRMVWTNTFLDLQNQWGSLSAQLAGTFASTFNTGISSISSNLTGLIMQTRTWAQALANIGNTILTTVIQSIVEMGVRWVLTRAMVGLANIAWSGKEAAAAAPFGLIQSISSFGVAALVGGAAFAGIMAAVGGFSEGGYTGNIGTSTPAGIVHGQEFVMSAPAVQSIGVGTLEAMNQTGGIPASRREQRIVIVDDARTASDLQNDPNFETVVVNLAAANAWRIRG